MNAQLVEMSPMLKTNDMAGTIRFYTEVLGFRLHSSWPAEAPCWCDLARDQISIMFTTQSEKNRPAEPIMTGRLYFRTDDVMEIYNHLKDQVAIIEGPEVYFYQMKEIAVQDNNGYLLTFGQPTDDAPTCQEDHD
ncbi:MAG: hypothetical protein HJJLKODD_02091 [Phycisphaerae bacterium]|nr:hypothetical protein [Phycisphaerae bacterium]